MTPQKFGPLIGGLMAATGMKLEPPDIEIWRRHTEDIPDDSLSSAFDRAAKTCKAFPSIALIRELAAESQYGKPQGIGDLWERVLRCVRSWGFYQREKARAELGPMAWKALGGDIGWEHLCDMEADQRATYAAQFRGRWEQLAGEEARNRALPEHLRPRIDDTPVTGLPEPPKALPHFAPPVQPTPEELERVKRLRIFREVDATPKGEREVDEASRQRQAEWLRRKIAEGGQT